MVIASGRVLEDRLISNLRVYSRSLQELVHYLESQPRLAREDVGYCDSRVDEIIRQLKDVRRMVRGNMRASSMPSDPCYC